MFRAPSPLFDVPEFPSLRRVKPLPKRRRTSDSPPDDDDDAEEDADADAHSPHSLSFPVPEGNVDLLSLAVSFSTHVALQSYYSLPGGAQDLLKPERDASRTSSPVDFGGDGRGHDDDDGGDGDYIDHLQQPGNTKKRKVPANMSGSARDGGDAGSAGSGEDEPTDRAIPSGRDYDAVAAPPPPPPPGVGAQKKGRLSRATQAGLQRKEILRSRKRQLAAVLGALSHGDTLALDQALSANYPFVNAGYGPDGKGAEIRIRLSRRREARLARAYRAMREARPPQTADSQGPPAPQSEFTFVCHSATSDRLITTKQEVAILHARFEAELARQAAKAAEAAKQAASMLTTGPQAKRADRSKQGLSGARGEDGSPSMDPALLGTKPPGGKKKKRSALANASNPHHLRNYVPSRVPHSGQANPSQAVTNAQSLLTPLPLRFLSAEIPPRRRKKTERAAAPAATLTNPADEWICPFCEYSLFYGDEQSYQRAVRSRKKILRRRRRARERAAAAASGVVPGAAAAEKQGAVGHEEMNAAIEPAQSGDALPAGGGKQVRWKEGDRGGAGVQPSLG